MIRSILVAFVTIAALGVTAKSRRVQLRSGRALKSEAIVSGDIVRIGDLIENAGIVASVPIFPLTRSWLYGHDIGRCRT